MLVTFRSLFLLVRVSIVAECRRFASIILLYRRNWRWGFNEGAPSLWMAEVDGDQSSVYCPG